MHGYYSQKLSAERLRRCYEVAPPRVKRYLEAEIEFVLERVQPGDRVLELGCGYGRVLGRLADKAAEVTGVDTSLDSLRLARETLPASRTCHLCAMDAIDLGFRSRGFDLTVCIQNGVSAFGVEPRRLIREAMRVTRSGGIVLLSSYAEGFWEERLEWFRIQSDHGLVGEIDDGATGHGVIVCKDGFRATTAGSAEFLSWTPAHECSPRITEVDGSSLFCEIFVKRAATG